MRLEFLGHLPRKCYVACSGGPDSMAILHFLTRDGKRDVEVLFYNHGTDFSNEGESLVRDYCADKGLTLHIGTNTDDVIGAENEDYFRTKRYEFFDQFTDRMIIQGHNLDDQVETWIFYSLRGVPKLMPYFREPNIIRPFTITKKEALEAWCDRKEVPYVVDPANSDYKNRRSFIRHEFVPRALHVNPGLYTTIKNKVTEEFDEE